MSHTVDVWHLKFDELQKLSKVDINGSKPYEDACDDGVCTVEALRMDDALVEKAKEVQALFSQLTNREELKRVGNKQAAWAKITEAALVLKERGWYEHVVTIHDTNLIDAWKATVSLNGHWFLNRSLKLHSYLGRRTMTLDIFSVSENDYLLTAGGFVNIKTNSWVS
jgi:hypothetical protein